MHVRYLYNSYVILLVLTEHIVEVREGQKSEGFDRYPYEEVTDQSFSVLVEGKKRGQLPYYIST